MDKRVQKRLKRDELDKMMKKYPSLNDFLTNVTDEDKKNPELQKILEPVVSNMLNDARMQGIHIGWSSSLVSLYTQVRQYKTVDEIVDMLREEANKELSKTGVKMTVDELITSNVAQAMEEI